MNGLTEEQKMNIRMNLAVQLKMNVKDLKEIYDWIVTAPTIMPVSSFKVIDN